MCVEPGLRMPCFFSWLELLAQFIPQDTASGNLEVSAD
jgi:hypothetical protein